jgi:hypothetical protein
MLKATLGSMLPDFTQTEKDMIKGSCDFYAIDGYMAAWDTVFKVAQLHVLRTPAHLASQNVQEAPVLELMAFLWGQLVTMV